MELSMCPAPRLACLSPSRWPGLDPRSSTVDGAGLTLPCGPLLPFRAPDGRHAGQVHLGNERRSVIGSGRYGPCWLGVRRGAGYVAEVTLWMLADGRVVVEPQASPPARMGGALAEVTLGAHLGADARAIALQMPGLHRLQLGRDAWVDTVEGPRPAEQLRPGARVATLGAGPQPVVAVLACRGSGRGLAAPWHLTPEVLGNARPLSLPPRTRLLPPAAPWLPPVPLEQLAPEAGLSRAPAPSVDWIVLGFERAQLVGLQGLFLTTCPPAPARASAR